MARFGVAACVAACLLLLAPPVGADHDGCTGALTLVELGTGELYVDERHDGTWVYLENGEAPGYNAGGSIAGVVNDPCGDPAGADLLVAHVADAP